MYPSYGVISHSLETAFTLLLYLSRNDISCIPYNISTIDIDYCTYYLPAYITESTYAVAFFHL